jgi:hypothetical protein
MLWPNISRKSPLSSAIVANSQTDSGILWISFLRVGFSKNLAGKIRIQTSALEANSKDNFFSACKNYELMAEI